MKKLNLNNLREESGASLVIVAIAMVVLLGFAAIAIDGGRLYVEKSRQQKVLDAAVLAGAQRLPVSQEEAVEVAKEYASKNNIPLRDEDIITTGPDFIEIRKTVEKELTFAKVLNIDSTQFPVVAAAKIGGDLVRREGVVPVGIEYDEFEVGEPYVMHFQPGNSDNKSVNGNFGFLNIDKDYAVDYNLRDSIKYGTELEISEDGETWTWTKTGLSWGQVQQGFQYRIDQDSGSSDCGSYLTADNSCSRLVYVPIVETYEDSNGTTLVKIVGFAAFWIESIGQHQVNGRFVRTISIGEFGELEEDFGVYRVTLVK